MPTPNPEAQKFLQTRQSYPAKMMTGPGPERDDLIPILAAALRVPDHGRLEPWRLIVVGRGAMPRLADLAEQRAADLGLEAEQAAKGRGQFDRSPMAVIVVASPKAAPKVPLVEQTLSAGAVCLGVVNAATAAGWAACWLTGWPAHDRGFVERGLGLGPQETVAGIIHIGRETVPQPERPRPDVQALTTWIPE